MRVDPLLKTERARLRFEAIGGDNCELTPQVGTIHFVILANEAREVVALEETPLCDARPEPWRPPDVSRKRWNAYDVLRRDFFEVARRVLPKAVKDEIRTS
jgi:hypothetical protein